MEQYIEKELLEEFSVIIEEDVRVIIPEEEEEDYFKDVFYKIEK